MLTDDQKKKLKNLAFDTIKSTLEKKKMEYSNDDPVLNEKRGVFVTLHKSGDLRGCIGYILPMKKLYTAVMENAVNAAFEDPRFPPLTKNELNEIDIEISVLTVPEPIKTISEIVLGKHGIILKNNYYQSVFLPQVAVEQKWNLEETLKHLSYKASGTPQLWNDNKTEYSIFEAEIF